METIYLNGHNPTNEEIEEKQERINSFICEKENDINIANGKYNILLQDYKYEEDNKIKTHTYKISNNIEKEIYIFIKNNNFIINNK